MFKPKILLYGLLFIEIILFLMVSKAIGVFFALLLIIAGSFVGFMLLRVSGTAILQNMQAQMRGGRPPLVSANDSLLMLAGILLIIPGFFTDCLALLCLIPGFYKNLSRILTYWGIMDKKPTTKAANDNHIIEGEFERKDD